MNPWLISACVMVLTSLLTASILLLLCTDYWRVRKRLKMISRDERLAEQGLTPGEGSDRFPLFSSALEHSGSYGPLERLLKRAGLEWRPDEYVAASIGAAIALAAAGWLLISPYAAAFGIVLAVAGSWLVPSIMKLRRLAHFENQLADALLLISSSLRSGYGLLRSLQAIRDEMRPPVSLEFAKVLDETAVGLSVPEALINLVQRVPLPDLDIAVTAIIIQLDVGGNLAEVLEIVAATVRERQRIRGEVATMTAEGRLSGVILFIMPIVMAVILVLLNPNYMSALFKTSFGHLLLGCAAVLQVIGGLVMMRMLEVDF